MQKTLFIFLLALLTGLTTQAAEPVKPPVPATFAQVKPIFAQHCISCHDAKEAEGKLVMETYALLMKGGEDGPVIIPGKASESPLIKQVEQREKPFMPPPKKGDRLNPNEIALLRSWIDAGAKGPAPGEDVAIARTIPKVSPTTAPRRSIYALAYEPRSKLLAVAVLNQVELRSAETQTLIATLGPHKGHVNALAFSSDGMRLFAASGEPGVSGQVSVWSIPDGKLLKQFEGHKDAIYAIAISTDGKALATGSYDQKIILWNQSEAKPLKTLDGHNGAIFDLAFRPDGKVLASASADRTIKLWEVESGKRLDTRSEPTKEQQAVLFSPDGTKLYAAGGDNRVRVWKISPTAVEGTNTLLTAQFAHEGSILRVALSTDGKTLVTSADDKTVKIWDAGKLELKRPLEPQSDWPTGLALALDSKVICVGRLDGSLSYYDAASAARVAPPKPELTNIEPRGLQRGRPTQIKLTGKNIAAATSLTIAGTDKLKATILPNLHEGPNILYAQITASADAPLGAFDLTASSPGGASAPAKLITDDLPQIEAAKTPPVALTLPITFGGNFTTPGQADTFLFEGKKDQTIVIDVGAKRFASKADPILTLSGPTGVLAMSTDDHDDPDPLLIQKLPQDGNYQITIRDLQGAASTQHYYRMSVGSFPYVISAFPLALPPGKESTVQLIGYNLPADASVKIKAPATGEIAVPIDPAKYRSRHAIRLLTGTPGETVEAEPNDQPAQAMKIELGAGVSGRFDEKPGGDIDLYRFDAKANQQIIIETQAAQRSSPADTRVEVLWPDGRPVQRLQLRAVRDSWITFRPIDAGAVGARLNNWEEMELNQYLYMQGEVVKLNLYPRGPDSEFNFYAMGGRRRNYFDTSATAHALDEKCYIVEPHKIGEPLAPNGLPVFTLNYANDDDQLRQLGSDSRLHFTAPADGAYLIRVTDTRNFGGPRFTYRLIARQAKPDFAVSIEGLNPTIPHGAGRSFTLRLDRIDGFDGPVTVNLGYYHPFKFAPSITIEAGHTEAQGTIFLPKEWPTTRPIGPPPYALHATATATIDGKPMSKSLGEIAKLTIGPIAPTTVSLDPSDPNAREITIHPGQRTTAILKVHRGPLKGVMTFDVENLPHGIIVSDIGLSGIMIPDGQEERQIFLQCAPWVTPQERPCQAKLQQADAPTSPPITLRVTQ